jgi:putative DNA primase/helicase
MKNNDLNAGNIADKILQKYKFITIKDNMEVYRYSDKGVYVADSIATIKEETEQMLGNNATIYTRNEVVEHIKYQTLIERKELDKDYNIINVSNGLLNINTLELQPHTPDYYSVIQYPIIYNPNVEAVAIPKFISEIVNTNDITLIEEVFGWILMRGYPIRKAFMFVGEGANGKTMLVNLIRRFVGDMNCSTISVQDLCDNRFASSCLLNKRVNICDDLQNVSINSVGKLKMVTGDSMIFAEKKGKDSFQFVNEAKMIFTCNKVPSANNADDAYYSRWILVDYPNEFSGENEIPRIELFDRLTTDNELTGLLNIAIRAYKRIISNKYNFSRSEAISDIRNSYLKHIDGSHSNITSYASECLIIDASNVLDKQALYDNYVAYCSNKELIPQNDKVFFKKLKRIFENIQDIRPTDDNGKRVRVCSGVNFKVGGK